MIVKLFALECHDDDFPPESAFLGVFTSIDKAKAFARKIEWPGIDWSESILPDGEALEGHWIGRGAEMNYSITPTDLDREREE